MAGTTTNFSWPYPTGPDVANVNSDMQSLASAIDTTLGSAWTLYTPTWTAASVDPVIGTGTIRGRFKLFGKWGITQGLLTMGGTTTFGTGVYSFTLPAGWSFENSVAILQDRGSGFCFDASTTTTYVGYVQYQTATTFGIRTHAGTAAVGPTVPVTFATTDLIGWTILTELQ